MDGNHSQVSCAPFTKNTGELKCSHLYVNGSCVLQRFGLKQLRHKDVGFRPRTIYFTVSSVKVHCGAQNYGQPNCINKLVGFRRQLFKLRVQQAKGKGMERIVGFRHAPFQWKHPQVVSWRW